jgi:hypothetical protein
MYYFFSFLGHHPFANDNGTINTSQLAMGKYTKIVTDEYDMSLINICHDLLNQVLFVLFLAVYFKCDVIY